MSKHASHASSTKYSFSRALPRVVLSTVLIGSSVPKFSSADGLDKTTAYAQGQSVSGGGYQRLANKDAQAHIDIWVDGTAGDDSSAGDEQHPLRTLDEAIKKAGATAAQHKTIGIKGTYTLTQTVSIPEGVTLFVAANGATIQGTGNAVDGLILQKGATLTGAGTLTMTGFKTALTAHEGSLITDGTYVFKNNGQEEGRGISLQGKVHGSTGKDKLTITADDICNSDFYTNSVVFENCTVSVTSQTRTWFDALNLTLKNACLSVAGFGMSYYVNNLTMENSEFTINKRGWRHATGLTIQGNSTIKDSTITANAGSTAGISVGAQDKEINVTNSSLVFNNGGTGGLNVNTGKVVLTDSTIKGNGKNSGALFGAQENGSIEFLGNCLVETPAATNADTGAGVQNHYIVKGGSYALTYAPNYHSSLGSTVPVNGVENGNEQLSLFTLADSSVRVLNPLNKQGKTYEYKVEKASADSKKHVWVPAATVTFSLNEPSIKEPVSAQFADGTTNEVKAFAMRGYSLSAAQSVAGGSVSAPSAPMAAGYKFLGWFYKNADGAEQTFNASTVVTADTAVYAKWEKDPTSYAVVYHNADTQNAASYMVSGNNAQRTQKVCSIEEVMKSVPKFVPYGKTFVGWSTDPQDVTKIVEVGSMLSIPQHVQTRDLYAVWKDKTVSIKFSANGGVFDAQSIFKTHPDVFDITKDSTGGEVAVVKKTAKISDKLTLNALLQSCGDGSVSAASDGLNTPESSDSAAYKTLAAKPYHVLDNQKEEKSVFGFVYSTLYKYWFSDVEGNAATTISGDTKLDNDYTYYLKWKLAPHVEQIHADTSIPADILVGTDTAHKQPYEVIPGQTVDFTGAISSAVVKDQMKNIEAKFSATKQSDYKNIALSDIKSSFVATFKVPQGLSLPDNLKPSDISTEGFSDTFSVSHVEVKDNTAMVTLQLKDGIQNYEELQTAVQKNLNDTMKLTIHGVKVHKDFTGTAQVSGSVQGSFSAVATKDTNGSKTIKLFSFTWKGLQTEEGRDSTATSVDDGIVFSVAAQQPISTKLYGDLLLADDTEHTAVPYVSPDTPFTVTGALCATQIKDQMNAIEAVYPNLNHKDIALDIQNFEFTATFSVPEGMHLPKTVTKDTVRAVDFGDGFVVKDVVASGNTLTVTFALKDEASLKTYDDLEKIVDAAGGKSGWMKLMVSGVSVDPNVADATQLTMKGTVHGTFAAAATSKGGVRKVFSFVWDATQWPDGKDKLATDDETIQLSVLVKKPQTEPHTTPDTHTPSVHKPHGDSHTPQTSDSLAGLATLLPQGIASGIMLVTGALLRKRRHNK